MAQLFYGGGRVHGLLPHRFPRPSRADTVRALDAHHGALGFEKQSYHNAYRKTGGESDY